MKAHMKYQRGFTLLELLVVVSIIGILVAMIMAGFSTAQTRSRDARRRGDLKSVQNAFEQYYANANGVYGTCGVMGASAAQLPGGMPVDPLSPTQSYNCTNPASGYCLCAQLEQAGSGNASDTSCSGTSGDYFCVRNLQ